DLQDSLLVNNGAVIGTTNVNYGATVTGSGSFGPINVNQGGVLAVSPSASPIATSLAVSSGSIAGAGRSALAGTIADTTVDTAALADKLTLSGDFSGAGPLSKIGAGILILSGTNTYTGGTLVDDGTLVDAANGAIPDGTSLTIGAGATLVFDSTAYGAPVEASSAQLVAVPEPGT